jgi:hypothetical protein
MSQYPTLKAMGVNSVDDVIKYTIRHQGDTDVLKIYYKREKGSFLSRSKKFSFVRGRRSIPIESRSAKGFESLSDISPQLTVAIQELDQLQATRTYADPQNPKEALDAHMDHLEKVVNDKLKEMQELIKDL